MEPSHSNTSLDHHYLYRFYVKKQRKRKGIKTKLMGPIQEYSVPQFCAQKVTVKAVQL